MKFTTKDELIEQAVKDGACYEGIEFANSCKDLQEIFEIIDGGMLRWCLKNGYDQFAEYCDLSVFGILGWVRILQDHPQYADYCDWSKFSGSEWAIMLQYHPQYADHCDWSKLSDYNWDCLLTLQPQFAVYRQKKNHIMKFTTKDELIKQAIFDGACDKWIEFAKSCKNLQEIFARIDRKMLLWCLDIGYEQFAEHCDLSVLDSLDFVAMLEAYPQYAYYCDWSKFSGDYLAMMLRFHPQYADHCDWSKFSDYDWDCLLPHQPQFAVYRQNSNGV